MQSAFLQRIAQLQLFHPRPKTPAWEELPQEVRLQTVRLLARLLGEHHARLSVASHTEEACDV